MFGLKKQYPRLRLVEDFADVMLVGLELGAIDEAHKQKKWVFLKKGAKDSAFYTSYKYGLLDKKEKELKRYFEYKRPHADYVDSDTAKFKALNRERRSLYAHMLTNTHVRDVIVKVLSLSTNDLNVIKRTLERGDLYEQLTTYGKIINSLTSEQLYHERYDYFIIGFRTVPHHYWLSKLALKILLDAKGKN